MKANTRKTIALVIDEIVSYEGEHYKITEILDFKSIVAISLDSGRSQVLRINDLSPTEKDPVPSVEIESISDNEWKIANKKYAIIKPLLKYGTTKAEVIDRGKKVGKAFTTLYRWIKLYNDAGSVEGLIPTKRGVKKGVYKINVHVENIIQNVINNVYLTKQRPTIQKVVQEVKRHCLEEGITEIPHANTIRARVNDIAPAEKLKKRGFREKARNKYDPVPGKFPNADAPLAYVQIDHTPVDIMLVDDVYRKSIGRPWITLATDVYSRMITGYYLSFDPPSATSVAMCVAHSVLKKDDWLSLHEVEAEWPVWGIMSTIHVDNGADFRSETFRKACEIHNIDLDYRPVRQPRFGGHVERVLGTFMKEVHSLPGTTFSNIGQREGYDSEKNAVLTISEFEKWLVTYICKVYHKSLHSGIGMTPERKWEIGVFGSGEIHGAGLPAIPKNKHNFLLDFLPMFKRSVQRYGISIDGLTYYADVLRRWINSEDKDNPKKKRNFIIRQDPRDISSIWFYDPEATQYFRIPFADLSLPSMSIWEYRKAKNKAKEEGMKSVNEHEILRAHTELIKQVEDSKSKTKKARRDSQKQKEHKKQIVPTKPINKDNQDDNNQQLSRGLLSDLSDGEIEPFEDIS